MKSRTGCLRVTVSDDGDFDLLTGSSGLDWFFFSLLQDDATDRSNDDAVN